MHILILGGTGMLGHKVFQHLRNRFPDTWCTLRGSAADQRNTEIDLFGAGGVVGSVDAADLPSLDRLLRRCQPQVTINCIGVIKQRAAAYDPVPCITVNALLPHRIAAVCSEWNGRLIHISTDCVFSGDRGGYREDDIPDAEDLYGRTKALGEVKGDNCLTLRTSLIGRELTGYRSLLEWFLAQRGGHISGYARAIFSGITTNCMSVVLERIITRHPRLSGLYHVAADPISKLDLLLRIREVFGVDVAISPDDSVHCDRSLNGEAFQRETQFSVPGWPELIRQIAEDPTPYEKWRNEITCSH